MLFRVHFKYDLKLIFRFPLNNDLMISFSKSFKILLAAPFRLYFKHKSSQYLDWHRIEDSHDAEGARSHAGVRKLTRATVRVESVQ